MRCRSFRVVDSSLLRSASNSREDRWTRTITVGEKYFSPVAPLSALLEQKVDEATKQLQCVKVTLLASLNGYAPSIAVEFGRKVLYSTERPTFGELETHVKQNRK